jgi:hypothetical protein
MTGSGSAAFGLFQDEESALHGERRLRALEAESSGGLVLQHTFVAPFCASGLDFSAATTS